MNRRAPSWVQHFTDGLRVALVFGAAYYAIAGDSHTAYGMALVAVTASALRFARAEPWIDFAFVGLLSIDSWLTATGAMAHISRDDHAGHFILAAALVPMIAALLVRLHGDSVLGSPAMLSVVAVALAISTGVAWELLELASDAWGGTNMSLSTTDSALDLLADVLGAITGGLISFLLWRNRSDRTSPID